MRKLMCLILALVFAGTMAGCRTGSKPYKSLTPQKIASATVTLTPPGKTLQLEEMTPLVALLNDVVLYEEDASYATYIGPGITFTLTLTDGTETRIMASNPFLVIDGVGYKTAYEPCKALADYANKLLKDEEIPVILEEPPVLNVVMDGIAYPTSLGTYSWQSKNDDETSTTVIADGVHPLYCKDSLLLFVETSEKTATLDFLEEPDAILSARCWSDAYWESPDAKSKNVSVDGNSIELQSGGHVYEVVAKWDESGGYGGAAHYAFYINAK